MEKYTFWAMTRNEEEFEEVKEFEENSTEEQIESELEEWKDNIKFETMKNIKDYYCEIII